MAVEAPPDGLPVSFTVVGRTRIDFVMPAGVAGESVDIAVRTAEGETTAVDVFTYAAPMVFTLDASTGGVLTTTSGLTLLVPSQGAAGTPVITLTSQPPHAQHTGVEAVLLPA